MCHTLPVSHIYWSLSLVLGAVEVLSKIRLSILPVSKLYGVY